VLRGRFDFNRYATVGRAELEEQGSRTCPRAAAAGPETIPRLRVAPAQTQAKAAKMTALRSRGAVEPMRTNPHQRLLEIAAAAVAARRGRESRERCSRAASIRFPSEKKTSPW
jgi:hypothetical protein